MTTPPSVLESGRNPGPRILSFVMDEEIDRVFRAMLRELLKLYPEANYMHRQLLALAEDDHG